MSSNPTKEGRSRIFHLGRSAILELLRPGQINEDGSIAARLLHVAELPADAYVSCVTYDHVRMAFCVQVDSMEFSPVVHGCCIPEIPVNVRTIEVAIAGREGHAD